MLQRIFERKREEITGGQKKAKNKKIHNLSISPNT